MGLARRKQGETPPRPPRRLRPRPRALGLRQADEREAEAERQAEAKRKAEAEAEAPDLARYRDAESLFQALEFEVEAGAEKLHSVRLVRMSWLLRQRGTKLKKRQDMPEDAFVPVGELRQVWEESGRGGEDSVAPIIAISFCWDTPRHPDPTGKQLNLVIDTLENGRVNFSRAYDSFKGFREMGVFWDWASLPQGDPVKKEQARGEALWKGKSLKEAWEAGWAAFRTPAEKAAFDHALHSTMDLWYAHQATTVFLLTQHPRERGSTRENGYDKSGWTTYERCSAEQIKQVRRRDTFWNAVADLGQGAGATEAGRGWPVGPDQFDRLIEDRFFTNGADQEAVRALFRRMSRAQLGGVTELNFYGLKDPTTAELEGLLGCLRLCTRLEELSLAGCNIGDAGAQAVAGALPSMPALQMLNLMGNAVGDAGAEALAGALRSTPGLEKAALRAGWGDRPLGVGGLYL